MSTQTSERGVPLDTFANRLMLARAYAGHVSILKAAELTGLGRGAWQNWERGTPPQNMAAVVEIIAGSLNVDREWLMWGGPLPTSQVPPRRPDGLHSVAHNSGVRDDIRRSTPHLPTQRDRELVPLVELPAAA